MRIVVLQLNLNLCKLLETELRLAQLEALNLNCSKIFHFIIEAQVLNEVVVVST